MGERLVDDVITALDVQTVTVPAEHTIGRVIADLAKELTRLAAAREKLAEETQTVFMCHPQAPILLSLPGMGVRTRPQILTEIGDITRFPTPGHLAAYAGLVSVTRQPWQLPPQERPLALSVLQPPYGPASDYYARASKARSTTLRSSASHAAAAT
jgi:Transposase IS116/IS110/IS902 family